MICIWYLSPQFTILWYFFTSKYGALVIDGIKKYGMHVVLKSEI